MPLFSGRCYSKVRLDGLAAIVTGSNTGIGKETVLDFYKRGARVIMACRDTEKANSTKEDIMKTCESSEAKVGEILVARLDLNSLKSVRECADYILMTEPKVNLLINNAGVMMCPFGKTEDGFETQIGTNHFGHFLFTMMLMPRIIKSTPARIVNVSSRAHTRGQINFEDMHFEKRQYNAMDSYSQSKLANVLFSKELANKLKENNISGVNTYSLHPGVVSTELGRHMNKTLFPGARFLISLAKVFFKSPESGAQTTIYCAVDEQCANETGLYYSDCVAVATSKEGDDAEAAGKLWDVSMKAVGLENCNPFTDEYI